MIHHLSFAARDPQTAATAIAALWGGEAYPFPPVGVGSWVAMAADERNTTIEVYALGAELVPVDGDADSEAVMNAAPHDFVATHAAIDTPLSYDQVFALAAEHGWIAKYRKRGGLFGVIEFWVEDQFLIEVLTAEMQAEYLQWVTPTNWRRMMAAGGPPKAA